LEPYGIGFGLYNIATIDSQQKTGNLEQILPSQRVNSYYILTITKYACFYF